MQTEWRSFQGGAWETEVNVRDFIQKNYHPYDGDDSFLEGPTQDTAVRLESTFERLVRLKTDNLLFLFI